MKKRYFFLIMIIFILLGAVICIKVANGDYSRDYLADVTAVNRLLADIEKNWDDISKKRDEQVPISGNLDYTVIGMDGTVYIMTRTDMAQTISAATGHYDTIRDIETEDGIVGRLIIHNPTKDNERIRNRKSAVTIAVMLSAMLLIMLIYFIYINRRVVGPFAGMKSFAQRIAAGNLDTPLEMDRGHVFGEFTEAFDIMREELKASREREEAAVKSRKELVAQLSHDIKTPVASIKAMAEVMTLTAKNDMEKDTLSSINGKADQIDKLISNLFHATLEELEQLDVKPEEISSKDIVKMITEADYLKKVTSPDIKDAVIIGDSLRLNQVISNIIYNSYKYAGTDITVTSRFEKMDNGQAEKQDSEPAMDKNYLVIEIADKGGGVPEGELDLIMEKFKRGSNTEGKDGAGLGLYISKYLMEKMEGGLSCYNNGEGLTAAIRVRVA
ncbi:MAG: HAMP domain-containing histidine kinase [Eubacterium sp.]|nr:HAMP domain-containing histidine kinase [Eubacterium sp.]